MSKEEKILSMIKELYTLNCEEIEDKELDDLYFTTKIALETQKELRGIAHD